MSDLVTLARHGGIAVVTVDNPPVNALSPGVPEGIVASVEAANADPAVKAIVVIGAGATFIAGADIREFGKMASPGAPRIDLADKLLRIENSAKPVVMAIHGTAFGGGLETAMAGHYRVLAASAQAGQPEVKLGLIPGAAGTQRLPRLAGVARALEMCATGEPVSAQEALEAGIADRLIPGDLLPAAIAFAEEIAGRPVSRTRDRAAKLADADPSLFAAARDAAWKTRRGQTAPLAAIEAVEAATRLPFAEGCELEARLFNQCLHGTQSKALIHAFFGERTVAKIPGIGKETPVAPIRRAAIVGGAPLSTGADGIAQACARAGIPVLAATGTGDQGLEAADIVVALPEDLALARLTFAGLGRVAKPECILATAASTLSIDAIAAATAHPERVIGFHFIGRLLEVVRGAATSAPVIATSMALAKKLKRIAVLSRDSLGFIAARMYARFLSETESLVAEGATAAEVTATLYDFGWETVLPAPEALPSPRAIPRPEILDRCLYALVNEGAKILEEGVALRAVDLDMVFLHGYGFPAWRGGPMFYADTVGLPAVLERIRDFERQHGPARWEPAPLLRQLVSEGSTFAVLDGRLS